MCPLTSAVQVPLESQTGRQYLWTKVLSGTISVGKAKYRSLVQPLVQHMAGNTQSTPHSTSSVKFVLVWGCDLLQSDQVNVYVYTQAWSENNNM